MIRIPARLSRYHCFAMSRWVHVCQMHCASPQTPVCKSKQKAHERSAATGEAEATKVAAQALQ
eukprot:6206807-Pleurochrysis_carterae.AAC.4